ncbi:glutamate-1-semialdehyde 2,1-aminomutase [Anaerocolumna cellulosilytica]|uniref:Glutamate-1-semialdehyde 2,1-aminomutase n=1 Tax=Anaerocolumna cellulosilytica TaxID=433286 RepID=A0A6S6R5S8_9FIRM|nr:aspartate aminotransferase family protein [Anaerocolumna cellulosilytica]MBB5196477.1 glutamate-1-semialdehyde-2,1-aminomutase [Anaerocolumna cellulosilytica]BCJ94401.1 glutamate-1-semialdehyde 2,1-aminomutase [Anaerocolumna cellulosilytica]
MRKKDALYLKEKIKSSYNLAETGKQFLIAHYTAGIFNDFVFFDHGKGSKMYDIDGNEYIDCAGGIGPLILGHSHEAVVNAATEAIEKGCLHGLGNEYEVRFAELLVESIPQAEVVTFTNSGTEATMHAIKLARAYTGKEKIAKFEGHYHGTHEFAQISGRTAKYGPVERPESVADYAGIPEYAVDGTITLSMNQKESFDIIRQYKDELAAVIVEPLPMYAPLDYKVFLKGLREVTEECGVLLIFDEVVTGFRLAFGGAREYFNIIPDLATYGKIIGGGFPAGAIVGTKKFFKPAYFDGFNIGRKSVFFTGTFSGNPVTCAAGIAVIEYLRDHKYLYEQMNQNVLYICNQIEAHANEIGYPLQTKSACSLFVPYFFKEEINKPRDTNWTNNIGQYDTLRKHMLKHGVSLSDIGVVFVTAAHSREDCDSIVKAFNQSIDEMY